MSKTARTPYKTKKKKNERDVRAVKNNVSDAAELWIAPNKQLCLQRHSNICNSFPWLVCHIATETCNRPMLLRRP